MTKKWFAFIPLVFDDGLVINAPTLEEAIPKARASLLRHRKMWSKELQSDVEGNWAIPSPRFCVWEIARQHICTLEEE